MKLILGSQSKSRKYVLDKAGYEFDVMPADIDEKAIRSSDWEEMPLLIARAKAAALLARITEPAILITADQVVVCNGELREKPESEEQARAYLKSYDRYPAQTNSAVVVTNTETGKQADGVDIAKTFFKPLPDDVITQAIESGLAMTVAGGFVIEDPLFAPYVDHLEGAADSVLGLPLGLMRSLIAQVE